MDTHGGAGPGGVAPLERPAVATLVAAPQAQTLRRVASTIQVKTLRRTVTKNCRTQRACGDDHTPSGLAEMTAPVLQGMAAGLVAQERSELAAGLAAQERSKLATGLAAQEQGGLAAGLVAEERGGLAMGLAAQEWGGLVAGLAECWDGKEREEGRGQKRLGEDRDGAGQENGTGAGQGKGARAKQEGGLGAKQEGGLGAKQDRGLGAKQDRGQTQKGEEWDPRRRAEGSTDGAWNYNHDAYS